MNLSAQTVAILRLSPDLLSSGELRQRLEAMDVANAGDVSKRLYHLHGLGAVQKVGEGRAARWSVKEGPDLARLEARWACEEQPRPGRTEPRPDSSRERVLSILRDKPGSTSAQLKTEMAARDIKVGKNEPAAMLHVLVRQGRVRAEGEHPQRCYFAVADAPPPIAKARLVVVRKPSQRGKTEDPIVVAVAAVPPAAMRQSDDPIDRLADAIQQHLELTAPWITSTLIAEDLDEEPLDVARALRRLVDAKRANVRTIGGVREYAVGVDWQPEAAPITLASVLQAHTVSEGAHAQTGQLEDVYGPISSEPAPASPFEFSRELPPVPEADRAAHRQAIDAAREALRDRYNDATAHPPHRSCDCAECGRSFEPTPSAAPVPPPAYDPDQVSFRNTQIANLVAAIGANPNTVAGLSRCIALDIEDAIGRACDQRMPHHAIKALATAAACMRRAIDTFTTGAPAPLTATDGVLQS